MAAAGQPQVSEPPSTPVEPTPFHGEAPLTLELRAIEEVWVRLLVDGNEVIDATLQPGQTHVFEGETIADLRIGNAGGLTIFWNGHDLGSLGTLGQVRRLNFSPTRVRPGPPPVPE